MAGLEGEARGEVACEVGGVGADASNHTRLPQLDDAPVVAGHALAPGLPPVHPLYCVVVGGWGGEEWVRGGWVRGGCRRRVVWEGGKEGSTVGKERVGEVGKRGNWDDRMAGCGVRCDGRFSWEEMEVLGVVFDM